ncbi:MAG: hypothetical protein AB7J13_16060 [Pyrinomonadaceae bacterium]
MESSTQVNDVPTALPGSEADDAREKLLLEATAVDPEIEEEDEQTDLGAEKSPSKKRGWKVIRTAVGFVVFLGILALSVSWFFEMGWFAASKPQPVSRNVLKDAQTSPETEDQKLKMALSMVALNDSKTNGAPTVSPDPVASSPPPGQSVVESDPLSSGFKATDIPTKQISETSASDPPAPSVNVPTMKNVASNDSGSIAKKTESAPPAIERTDSSGDTPGRSLFFGVSRKPPEPSTAKDSSEKKDSPDKMVPTVSASSASTEAIPFGTLLPVRLVGSIYTFRRSGGFVRMELTRQVEGNGFSYPAGTKVIGNIRGGESSRAFVTIIGLIDPSSGALVKFEGELLGKDGASGIEGRRRRLTSQWARFFNGLKETASSVLGSVGALKSGGTVILTEPIKRGSESMSENLSDVLNSGGKENTFIEVSAGSTGFVLVTGLPDASSAPATKSSVETEK